MRFVKCALLALLTANLLSAFSYAEAPDRITGAIDASQVVPLARSVHPNAQARFDQGAVEPTFELSYVTLTIAPSPAQQKALDRLLAEQQDPNSPNYHKWLTPAEYADRFGLNRNDTDRIIGWLKAQGFTILSIGSGRNFLIFKGTAAQVQSAFRTEIRRYNVNGEEHFANATPVMIPAALKGIVTGIRGLHDFRPKPASRLRSLGPTRDRLRPDYYDPTWLFPNFLAPADINTIYDIPSTLDGAGQTIAIVGDSDIFEADLDDFRQGFGISSTSLGCTLTGSSPGPAGVITACDVTNFQYVPVGTDTPPNVNGDIVEADLDLEWSSSIAPGAKIIFVNAPATGAFDALVYAISPNGGAPLAPIISVSFGGCEYSDIGAGTLEPQLTQAAGEGVTVLVASGDSGAAACDYSPPNSTPPYSPAIYGVGVNYPASSPNVVAVGGTSISYADDANPPTTTSLNYWGDPTTNPTNGGTAKMYIPELTWNDDEDIADYCVGEGASADQKLCTQGTAKITSAQIAQQYFWTAAGGGGMSNCGPGLAQNATTCQVGFTQPAWQQTLSVPGAPAGTQYRYVPDVSLLASDVFPGYVFCTPLNEVSSTTSTASSCATSVFDSVDTYHSIVGGTSAATPTFAAMVALLRQSLSTTTGLGNINASLYKLAATPSNNVFHQTTGGSNIVYCQEGLPAGEPNLVCPSTGASPGEVGFEASNYDPTTHYNLVTGLGSVDVGNLVSTWTLGQISTTTALTASLTSTYQTQSVTLTATVTQGSGTTTPTGSVTFSYSDNGGTLTTVGSATLNSSGVATLNTTALPVGSDSITASYSGSMAASTSTATTVTVAPAFTLTPPSGTVQVTQGQSINVQVALALASGFTGTVTFACPNPGSEMTCTPPPVTNASGTVTFNVATTAPSGDLRRPFDRQRIFYAALFPGLVGIMFTFSSRKRALGGMRMLGLIMVLGFSTLWLGSCGGNNSSTSNPGTPKGPYTINVSGTSGSITVPASFQLSVQ